MAIISMLSNWLINWLNKESSANSQTLCNFKRLRLEIRPGDVVLVEGRTRASRIVKAVTHSIWTHSAIYIGRLSDIKDAQLRKQILEYYPARKNEQLLIEPLLGEGTIITPLSKYRHDHVRVCRPNGVSPADIEKVIHHVVQHLGLAYNMRQVFDMARFIFPYSIVPRRLFSSLFEHQPDIPDKTVCSSMIASAFSTIDYPIRPIIRHKKNGGFRLYKRNTRLYVPGDFDASPYFDIFKYPHPGLDDPALYHQLPWDNNGMVCNTENECFVPIATRKTAGGFSAIFNRVKKQVLSKLPTKQLIPLAITIPGIKHR